MKILHVATGLQKASGVTTFVEGASAGESLSKKSILRPQ